MRTAAAAEAFRVLPGRRRGSIASAFSSESLAGSIVLLLCVLRPSTFALGWSRPCPCPCAFNVSVGLLDESSVGCGAQAAGERLEESCCQEGQVEYLDFKYLRKLPVDRVLRREPHLPFELLP